MYSSTIHEMVDLLRRKFLIGDHEVGSAKEVLEEYWSDKIADVWTADDIIEYYRESQDDPDSWYELDRGIAIEVLQMVHHRFDASIGINWDVIDSELDDFRAQIQVDWVKKASDEQLPLLVGRLDTDEGRAALETRMKGVSI